MWTRLLLLFRMQRTIFRIRRRSWWGIPRARSKNSQKSAILASYDLDPKKNCFSLWRQSRSTENQSSDYRSNSAFAKKDYQLLYASGDRYYQEIEEKIGMSKDAFPNISIRPYIDQMAEVMANSDLLIGRAGATSIAEFTALGLPAILIPSPYVTNDHQTKMRKA